MITSFEKKSGFILSLIVLFTPFSNYITTNFFEINFVVIKSLSILLLVHLLISIILFFFFKIFLKNIRFYYFPILLFLIFNIFTIDTTNRSFSIFFILIITALILIFLICQFIKNQKYIIIFFLIYFVFLILMSLVKLDYKNIFKSYGLDKDLSEISYDLKVNSKKNIYFIIYDQMVSLEKFYKYSTSLTEFEKKIKINFDNFFDSTDFFHIKNNYSNYPKTGITLGSLFNLDNVIEEDEFQIIFSQNIFPDLIFSSSKNDEFNLLKNLRKINYNFYWFGNTWANCTNSNNSLKYCYSNNYNFFEKNLSYRVVNSFYDNNWFSLLYRKIFQRYTPDNFSIHLKQSELKNCHPNHSTCNFINSVKSNNKLKKSNNFVFIHNLIPHNPYIFDNECNYLENEIDQHGDIEQLYKNAYNCSLKDIQETTDFIIKQDPNSIIIIASDHGINFHDSNSRIDEVVDRLDRSVITLVYNKSCKNVEYDKKGINNLINYTFNCLQNENIIDYKPNICFDFKDFSNKIYKSEINCD